MQPPPRMHPPIQLLDKIKVLETQQHAVVVDYSDAHGLCYGVVFPNANGHSGRTNNLQIHWFEPEEIEKINP